MIVLLLGRETPHKTTHQKNLNTCYTYLLLVTQVGGIAGGLN
jgi:hypothetical protein